MATISILANTVRPSQIGGYDLWVETFSWQDPVHSWKAGPCEVMTVKNLSSIRSAYQFKSRSFLSAGLASKSLEIHIGYIRHPSSDLA